MPVRVTHFCSHAVSDFAVMLGFSHVPFGVSVDTLGHHAVFLGCVLVEAYTLAVLPCFAVFPNFLPIFHFAFVMPCAGAVCFVPLVFLKAFAVLIAFEVILVFMRLGVLALFFMRLGGHFLWRW